MAILSLILGILSFVLIWIPITNWISFLIAVSGIVLGVREGWRRSKIATAGTISSVIALVIILLIVIIAGIVGVFTHPIDFL